MRIGIVNDVRLAVESLSQYVRTHTGHEVAWTAADGLEAVRKCAQDVPDLILMDILMPNLDGVEATRIIMRDSPTAILIVTASIERLTSRVFQALEAGAMDAVNSPVLGESQSTLRSKIEQIAILKGSLKSDRLSASHDLVVIGASSGGPAALGTLLGGLTADFPGSIAISQHIDTGFVKGLASWLNKQSPLEVGLLTETSRPLPGHVYLSQTERPMVLTAGGELAYVKAPEPELRAIDRLFTSAAANWKGRVVGVLLTGMGNDGANGLLEVRRKGFVTIAQDEATCAIYGMPKAAVERGAVAHVLPIGSIAAKLQQLTRPRLGVS